MSSWFLSRMPSVCSIVAGSSSVRSSATSAADPVERFRHARGFVQIRLPQLLNERRHLLGQPRRSARHFGVDDPQLLLEARILDPEVQAAPFQRVVQLACSVRGDDDDRRNRGADRAELGDRDLKVGQQLEEKPFEFLVGAIELVDQQHRRPLASVRQRLQQRPLDQEFLGEQLTGGLLADRPTPAASINRISSS